MGALSIQGKRVFIAVRIPRHVARELAGVHEAISPFFGGRFTQPGSLHVPLKYLKESDDRTIGRVERALANASLSHVIARIDGFGTNEDTIWANVHGLSGLQRSLDNALRTIATPEQRFTSQLTIAHVTHTTNEAGLRAALKALHVPVTWSVETVELVETNGTRYETIGTYPIESRILA